MSPRRMDGETMLGTTDEELLDQCRKVLAARQDSRTRQPTAAAPESAAVAAAQLPVAAVTRQQPAVSTKPKTPLCEPRCPWLLGHLARLLAASLCAQRVEVLCRDAMHEGFIITLLTTGGRPWACRLSTLKASCSRPSLGSDLIWALQVGLTTGKLVKL